MRALLFCVFGKFCELEKSLGVNKNTKILLIFCGHFTLLVRHIDVSTKEATATIRVDCHIRLFEKGVHLWKTYHCKTYLTILMVESFTDHMTCLKKMQVISNQESRSCVVDHNAWNSNVMSTNFKNWLSFVTKPWQLYDKFVILLTMFFQRDIMRMKNTKGGYANVNYYYCYN